MVVTPYTSPWCTGYHLAGFVKIWYTRSVITFWLKIQDIQTLEQLFEQGVYKIKLVNWGFNYGLFCGLLQKTIYNKWAYIFQELTTKQQLVFILFWFLVLKWKTMPDQYKVCIEGSSINDSRKFGDCLITLPPVKIKCLFTHIFIHRISTVC